MSTRLRLVGVFLIIVGLGFFAGSGVAYGILSGGQDSLQKFSEVQNVELAYNEDGQLTDRGTTEGADAIMAMLTDDWGYPVKDSELDPDDPLVNTASEYMYQMATIVHHVIDGTQMVTLTEADLTGQDGTVATEFMCNGETVSVPTPFPAQGMTCEFAVDGRYWTDFDRMDPVQGKAREMTWTGTVHGLVGELGVGTVTASTLQLAGGVVLLLAGLGAVFLLSGAGLVWAAAGAREGARDGAAGDA